MKLSYYYAYIALSNIILIAFACDAALTFQQFFPTVVFLTSSRVFSMMVANAAAANILLSATCIRKMFFGSLAQVERQRMNEEFFAQIFESAVGLAYFQGVLTTSMTVAFVLTVAFKMFHVLAVSRLESIERSVQRQQSQIRRLAIFLWLAMIVDAYFMVMCASHVYERGVNIYLMLLLHFCVMSLTAVVTNVKLLLHAMDDGGEGRGPARFYVEIFSTIIDSVLYVTFFMAMMRIAMPLHLIRDLFRSLRNAAVTLRSFVKYRRLATNIDRTFATANDEDLERDRRCAICYDDMLIEEKCKKLSCGHCYHRHCLRKWFEKNSSCPYCRKEVDDTAPQEAVDNVAQAAAAATRAAAAAPHTPNLQGQADAVNGPAADIDDAVDEASVRQAYEVYMSMHLRNAVVAMEQQESKNAAPASGLSPSEGSSVPTSSSSGTTTVVEEDEVLLLNEQIRAYEAFRDDVAASTRRLDEKLLILQVRRVIMQQHRASKS